MTSPVRACLGSGFEDLYSVLQEFRLIGSLLRETVSFSICHSTLRSDFAPVHSSLVYVFVMMAM